MRSNSSNSSRSWLLGLLVIPLLLLLPFLPVSSLVDNNDLNLGLPLVVVVGDVRICGKQSEAGVVMLAVLLLLLGRVVGILAFLLRRRPLACFNVIGGDLVGSCVAMRRSVLFVLSEEEVCTLIESCKY